MDIINHKGKLLRGEGRHDGWTLERRAIFLQALQETASVIQAERAAGMGRGSANKLRKRDAEFAQAWVEALEVGYARLEHELLAHALCRAEPRDDARATDILPPDDAEAAAAPQPEAASQPEAVRPFDPELAIRVLMMRGRAPATRAKRAAPPATPAEVDAALMEKLESMARTMGLEKPEEE